MTTVTVGSNHVVPLGSTMPVIRPRSLTTDWNYRIRERDTPANVKDFSATLIVNSTRHVFVSIDNRYVKDVVYEVQIIDATLNVISTGYFQIESADFGSAANVDFTPINAKLRLAAGLSGLDCRWIHENHDPVTGIPIQSKVIVYTDATMTRILARGVLKRRLNSVRQVVGEVMYLTEYTPENLLPETTTGTSTETTGGSGS